jgi:hypothetical protein
MVAFRYYIVKIIVTVQIFHIVNHKQPFSIFTRASQDLTAIIGCLEATSLHPNVTLPPKARATSRKEERTVASDVASIQALDWYEVACVLQKCNAICVLPKPPIPVKTTIFWPGSLLSRQSSVAFSSDSRPKKAGVAEGKDWEVTLASLGRGVDDPISCQTTPWAMLSPWAMDWVPTPGYLAVIPVS